MKTNELLELLGQVDPALIERAALPDEAKSGAETQGNFAERIFAEAVSEPERKPKQTRFPRTAAAAAIALCILANAGIFYGIRRMRQTEPSAATSQEVTEISVSETSVSEGFDPSRDIAEITAPEKEVILEINPYTVSPTGCTLTIENHSQHNVDADCGKCSVYSANGSDRPENADTVLQLPEMGPESIVSPGMADAVRLEWGSGFCTLESGDYILVVPVRINASNITYRVPFTVPDVEWVTVPDVTEIGIQPAMIVLERLKLGVEIYEEYSDTVPEGIVYASSPTPGALAAPNGLVALYVSKGPWPEDIPAENEKEVMLTFSLPETAQSIYTIRVTVDYGDDRTPREFESFMLDQNNRTCSLSVRGKGKAAAHAVLTDQAAGGRAEIGIYDIDFDALSIKPQYTDIKAAVDMLNERAQNTFDQEVSISAKDVTPTGCTVVFTNGGSDEATYGFGYYVSLEDETRLIPKQEMVFNSLAGLIPMGGSAEMPVNWSAYYGELPSGNYRIHVECAAHKNYADFTVP